jgi:hypothetical protein
LDALESDSPEDELLPRRWCCSRRVVERSVHEVVEVTPGAGLVVRDIRTGDLAEVRERLRSTQLMVGGLIYAHVVPDGRTHQMVSGVMPVPRRLRDQLIALLDEENDAVDLAELLAAGVRTNPAAPDRP